MQRLRVSNNKRFLQHEDGTPFFWLADTAWELLHALDQDEVIEYLDNRKAKGFNVIQTVVLAENDGIRVPNAYGKYPLKKGEDGEYNVLQWDLDSDYSYWDHVNFVLEEANKREMYLALLPAWGDKFNIGPGKGPEVINPNNAREYGQMLANHVNKYINVIWVLDGDRPLESDEHKKVMEEMAYGIKSIDQDGLITLHPPGNSESRTQIGDPEWLDFHMLQTGHIFDRDTYRPMCTEYSNKNIKPVVDAELHYESHPMCFNQDNMLFDDFDVRQGSYWSVFSGGFGVTYGNHCIWIMNREVGKYFRYTWQEALDHPGAGQMKFLKELMLSRSFFDRVPAQDCLINALSWDCYMAATKGEDYIFVYNPRAEKVSLYGGKIKGKTLKATWYDPRYGIKHDGGIYPNEGKLYLDPPSKNHDWVLILDSIL